MYIDIFELVPDNDKPRKDCYDCLGCSHLIAINVDRQANAIQQLEKEKNNIEVTIPQYLDSLPGGD